MPYVYDTTHSLFGPEVLKEKVETKGSLPCTEHLCLQCRHVHATLGQVLWKKRQEGVRELEGSRRRTSKLSYLFSN
jgi:hypothetical protein